MILNKGGQRQSKLAMMLDQTAEQEGHMQMATGKPNEQGNIVARPQIVNMAKMQEDFKLDVRLGETTQENTAEAVVDPCMDDQTGLADKMRLIEEK